MSRNLADVVALTSDASAVLTGRRILVVMPTIPLYGMERKTLNIMKHLRERGADVLFITQKDHGHGIQEEVDRIGCRWVTASFDKLLHFPRGPMDAASLANAWIRSARELAKIRKVYKPTHIHIPDFTLFLYSWPVLLGATETVVFALPTPPDTSFTGFRRYLNAFIWRHGVARVCDHIVCNSNFTLSEFERVGVARRKARVIYNSAPTRTHVEGDAPSVNRLKLNVAFVGRIREAKGVRELVEAACRIVAERHDVDFYLAGDYSWQNPFATGLMADIRAKGLDDRLRFLGEIHDIPQLLEQCDLHVCPSFLEAFGLVVLEAKTQGIPSVVFPSGGLKETVQHLVDGYVCSDKTAASLYGGIRFFLDAPDVMRRAGREALRSLSRFSERQVENDWVALFKEPKAKARVRDPQPEPSRNEQLLHRQP